MSLYIEYGTKRILGNDLQQREIWRQIKSLETEDHSNAILIRLKDSDIVIEEIYIKSGTVLPDGRVFSID